jgi:hypothetical protein
MDLSLGECGGMGIRPKHEETAKSESDLDVD